MKSLVAALVLALAAVACSSSPPKPGYHPGVSEGWCAKHHGTYYPVDGHIGGLANECLIPTP